MGRVVDQDVDAAEYRRRLADRGAHRLVIGHIGDHRVQRGAGRPAPDGCLAGWPVRPRIRVRSGVAVDRRHPRAARGEQPGGGQADARSAPGHHGGQAGELTFAGRVLPGWLR